MKTTKIFYSTDSKDIAKGVLGDYVYTVDDGPEQHLPNEAWWDLLGLVMEPQLVTFPVSEQHKHNAQGILRVLTKAGIPTERVIFTSTDETGDWTIDLNKVRGEG